VTGIPDHDRLIRIDEKCDGILKRLEAGEKKFECHNKRIGKLEQAIAAIAAISIVVASVMPWVIEIYKGLK